MLTQIRWVVDVSQWAQHEEEYRNRELGNRNWRMVLLSRGFGPVLCACGFRRIDAELEIWRGELPTSKVTWLSEPFLAVRIL